jgi:hypothetical protein
MLVPGAKFVKRFTVYLSIEVATMLVIWYLSRSKKWVFWASIGRIAWLQHWGLLSSIPYLSTLSMSAWNTWILQKSFWTYCLFMQKSFHHKGFANMLEGSVFLTHHSYMTIKPLKSHWAQEENDKYQPIHSTALHTLRFQGNEILWNLRPNFVVVLYTLQLLLHLSLLHIILHCPPASRISLHEMSSLHNFKALLPFQNLCVWQVQLYVQDLILSKIVNWWAGSS